MDRILETESERTIITSTLVEKVKRKVVQRKEKEVKATRKAEKEGKNECQRVKRI